MRPDVTARFWSKVDRSGDCWVWTACRHRDRHGAPTYGMLRGPNRTTLKAHRVSYEIAYGLIPEGQAVLHGCDNYACVRPTHLYLGTQLDNIRDMVERHRTPHGQAANRRGKLTVDQVRTIRRRRAAGEALAALAAEFNVSSETVRSVSMRATWGWLDR